MKKCLFLTFIFALSLLTGQAQSERTKSKTLYPFTLDTLNYFDTSRNRKIPVALYSPQINKAKVVIFSHGYGQNKGGDYLAYSYLTNYLAASGYFVASIQHELPTDELIPSTGVPQIVRRPFWERGVENILFVINQLKKTFPDLYFDEITLIGHSNGGDMTALFPQKHPGIVTKIITLDNRRMHFPKDLHLKIYTLRSSDQSPDEGVIPTEADIKTFGTTIIKLSDVKHNDMDDHASDRQRNEIQQYILRFLKD